jgi:glycosyltransferase involved in cell wall biosynthesis
VIDLHGPLLLETLFRQGAEVAELFDRKVEAFSRAHFFTCAGERQKHYFFAWLLLAGFDLRRPPIEVVRFSLPPKPPVHEFPGQTEFVFGGHFLPWQNPALGLEVLVQELESCNQGHLWLFGSYHTWVETGSLPAFERVRRLLSGSGRATVSPALDRTALIERYRRMSVAWDLMPYNCERGMAFTSRTAEYLWAGLPVVHQGYAELSELISAYEAGWLIDPEDPEAIRSLVRRILSAPEEIRARGRNAQALARDWLDWSRTIAPLDAFVRNPENRRGRSFRERDEG